ncbi:MAG TPA: hypothetical protein PKK06_16305 [Phycisphaerae bacterium]|nr:hypothetical protein [Phycisphaerae bacterium]HNU46199.1 hypothetical protein [Phycisphaerae bacterium]
MSRAIYTLAAAVIACFLLSSLSGCDADLLYPVPGYYNAGGYELLGKSPAMGFKHRHDALGVEVAGGQGDAE